MSTEKSKKGKWSSVGDILQSALPKTSEAPAGEPPVEAKPIPAPTPPALEQALEMVRRGMSPTNPELQRLVKSLSPDKRDLVERSHKMLAWARAEEEARREVQKIKAVIAEESGAQSTDPFCSPLPTDLCCVSPFFPMRRQDLHNRTFIEEMRILRNSWGELNYYGPKLSTYEEDALLAVLALLDSKKNRRTETTEEGRTTYSYRGPLLLVLRLMGYKTRPGKGDYRRVTKALKLLTVAGMQLTVYGKSTRGKRKVRLITMSSMLSLASWDEKLKELVVTVNPYFYEMYVNGSVTFIDVAERAKIKRPIAKALMRFMQSHRDTAWEGHFLTLVQTLNLNPEQPAYESFRDHGRSKGL